MCNRLPPRGRRDLRLSAKQVADLADEISASAGVVAGRSQFETNDSTRFNRPRRRVPHDLFLAPV